ncbi:acylphosphatase [Secundilactobacillus paracollinoides]|uniref:acylphosphatase n=1 Tax=Secundilactobacillus paracollinoides TaxID=240427 RepID=A0A1B2J1K9_9LACO|nr:acylphosphatase [Secundilactobacillus paracollinoides]ANZ62181.1 hypothetical protein AYR61_13060 [Secundilactobacillus paracollinoides]ANZ68128.1 hypothetical protein AYR63_13935 [Secundilactobacillus paracollinoides]KRL76389.1 hypothetical protein FC17_GL001892 [Secundilactobacillus paracollinoides DSM 15502 = JCM 11969]
MASQLISVVGRVQGVGFRWSTKRMADELNVTGWVKNERDGTVSVLAQADSETLATFVAGLKRSPSPYAVVDAVHVKPITAPVWHEFNITN